MRQPRAPYGRILLALSGSQFFAALADNALLIVAIGLLMERGAQSWMSPALRTCLYLSYVVLAPFAGTLADAWPKGRLIVLTNLVKLGACLLLAANVHPLLAFGAVGLAGVCNGPAKYGILAALVPGEQLVFANAWIEISSVAAILAGVLAGGFFLETTSTLMDFGTPARSASLPILGLYAIAAVFAAAIPKTGRASRYDQAGAWSCAAQFGHAVAVLWRDPDGQVALAVTSLFWAVAAALQFLLIQWATTVVGLSLAQAALMQCFLAVGMIAGSAVAARMVSAVRAGTVLPAGIALGIAILLMTLVSELWVARLLLCLTGVVAGIVLIPMNALLQLRGIALMEPGMSIAVQSFNENLAALVFLAAYGAMLMLDVSLRTILAECGILVTLLMALIFRQHRGNRRRCRSAAGMSANGTCR